MSRHGKGRLKMADKNKDASSEETLSIALLYSFLGGFVPQNKQKEGSETETGRFLSNGDYLKPGMTTSTFRICLGLNIFCIWRFEIPSLPRLRDQGAPKWPGNYK